MSLTRRELMLMTGAAALTLPGARVLRAQAAPRKNLKILFIGGTGFIGPHMVRHALERGHTVTLFNRGRSNPGLFRDVERLTGNRDGGLGVLKGRSWDAVVDTSGYIPRTVRDSAQLLKDSVRRYLFISTGDVYATFNNPGLDENAPLDVLADPKSEDASKNYGAFKVICEKEVRAAFPDRHTIFRPGWIIGAGDYNPISAYWPVRIDRGGEVLAPGDPSDPTQYIDAADLGRFTIKCLEEDINGTFNTVGPAAPLTWGEFLWGIRAVTSAPVKFTWVHADGVAELGLSAFTDFPIWFPPRNDYKTPPMFEPGGKYFAQIDGRKAVAAGLTCRPLAATARDIIDEWNSRGEAWDAKPRRFGLSSKREAEALAAWAKRNGGTGK
jgi:2'-hydroxyisoflavone reductase